LVVEVIAVAVAAPLVEQRDTDDGQPGWNDNEDATPGRARERCGVLELIE